MPPRHQFPEIHNFVREVLERSGHEVVETEDSVFEATRESHKLIYTYDSRKLEGLPGSRLLSSTSPAMIDILQDAHAMGSSTVLRSKQVVIPPTANQTLPACPRDCEGYKACTDHTRVCSAYQGREDLPLTLFGFDPSLVSMTGEEEGWAALLTYEITCKNPVGVSQKCFHVIASAQGQGEVVEDPAEMSLESADSTAIPSNDERSSILQTGDRVASDVMKTFGIDIINEAGKRLVTDVDKVQKRFTTERANPKFSSKFDASREEEAYRIKLAQERYITTREVSLKAVAWIRSLRPKYQIQVGARSVDINPLATSSSGGAVACAGCGVSRPIGVMSADGVFCDLCATPCGDCRTPLAPGYLKSDVFGLPLCSKCVRQTPEGRVLAKLEFVTCEAGGHEIPVDEAVQAASGRIGCATHSLTLARESEGTLLTDETYPCAVCNQTSSIFKAQESSATRRRYCSQHLPVRCGICEELHPADETNDSVCLWCSAPQPSIGSPVYKDSALAARAAQEGMKASEKVAVATTPSGRVVLIKRGILGITGHKLIATPGKPLRDAGLPRALLKRVWPEERSRRPPSAKLAESASASEIRKAPADSLARLREERRVAAEKLSKDVAFRGRKAALAVKMAVTVNVADRYGIQSVDILDGSSFERFLAELFRVDGHEVMIVGGSGDGGGDLILTKDGKTTAVQAKRYAISSSVGNKAVQEVHTARSLRKCENAWIVTTSYFTAQAKAEAKNLGIRLIERDELGHLIDDHNESLQRILGRDKTKKPSARVIQSTLVETCSKCQAPREKEATRCWNCTVEVASQVRTVPVEEPTPRTRPAESPPRRVAPICPFCGALRAPGSSCRKCGEPA